MSVIHKHGGVKLLV